jgi:hypothetical protein
LISFRSALARAAVMGTTTAMAVGGLMVVGASPSSAALKETDFGFQGTAYGTRVLSQGSGLESGRSAFSWIACTRLLGRTAENHIATIDLPADSPSIHVSGVQSDNETYRRKAQGIDAAIRSTNTIAQVTLGGDGTPVLDLEGLTSTSTAWATTAGKLRSKNDVTLASISLTGIDDPGTGPLGDLFDALNGGIDQVLQALIDNGGSIEIPGLGVVSVGYNRHSEKKNFAVAASFVLRVLLYGSDGAAGGTGTAGDTLVGIGHSRARINRNVPAAVMSGVGYGANAEVADGVVSVGRLGAQPLPCQGTGGRILSAPTAGLNFLSADQLIASAVTGRAWGVQKESGVAKAWTEGSVANLMLGPLELRGIVGRVNLKQNRFGKVVRQDIDGSSIGKIIVNGENQGSLDPSTVGQAPPIDIPGVASIRFFVKDKTKRGMSVSAVVIKMLDGTPGVSTVRLGNAQATLKRY